MTEANFQRKIIQWLKANKVWHFKTVVVNINGVPDIICCHKGRFIGLEVKKGSKLSDIQQYQIEQIKNNGGLAYEINPDNYLKILHHLFLSS